MNHQGVGQISGILILMLLAIGGGIGIYVTASEDKEFTTSSVLMKSEINSNSENSDENVYLNDQYGFMMNIPDGWTSREAQSSAEDIYFTLVLEDTLTEDVINLSIMSPSLEGMARNSISINNEYEELLGGIEATRLVGESLKDGSVVEIILAKTGEKMYEITSSAPKETLDNILSGFMMLE